MTSDSGARERRPRPDHRLPRVVSIATRLVRFVPPERRNFASSLPRLERTVEFLVETDGPIPVRALSPVVYVGDVPVAEVAADDDTHYRFTAMEPERLEEGAPVTLGWSGEPASQRTAVGEAFVTPRG